MLTTAVASKDATSSGNLRALLEQTGLARSVAEWTTSSRGEWQLGSGQTVPDVVFLDLQPDVEPFFALAAQLRRRRPTVRLVACSPWKTPDPELLLRAMRAGVQEFLPKPVQPDALKTILERFLQEGETGPAEEATKVIVLMGAKGGVGTSTIAVNLGVQLSNLTRKRVVLFDLARPLGHDALLLDLQPKFSIRDAVENLERLDSHFLGGLLVQHKSGLQVLAGASHPDHWQRLSVPSIARVVNVAQSASDFVVIDLGSVYSSEWKPVLSLARLIFLIAEANVPSLWSLDRQLLAVSSIGFAPHQIHIIVNRWHRKDEDALKSMEKNLKRRIFARLPNDFRQVSEAVNFGVPLSRNHNDQLTASLRRIAAVSAGIPPPARRNGVNFSVCFLWVRGGSELDARHSSRSSGLQCPEGDHSPKADSEAASRSAHSGGPGSCPGRTRANY